MAYYVVKSTDIEYMESANVSIIFNDDVIKAGTRIRDSAYVYFKLNDGFVWDTTPRIYLKNWTDVKAELVPDSIDYYVQFPSNASSFKEFGFSTKVGVPPEIITPFKFDQKAIDEIKAKGIKLTIGSYPVTNGDVWTVGSTLTFALTNKDEDKFESVSYVDKTGKEHFFTITDDKLKASCVGELSGVSFNINIKTADKFVTTITKQMILNSWDAGCNITVIPKEVAGETRNERTVKEGDKIYFGDQLFVTPKRSGSTHYTMVGDKVVSRVVHSTYGWKRLNPVECRFKDGEPQFIKPDGHFDDNQSPIKIPTDKGEVVYLKFRTRVQPDGLNGNTGGSSWAENEDGYPPTISGNRLGELITGDISDAKYLGYTYWVNDYQVSKTTPINYGDVVVVKCEGGKRFVKVSAVFQGGDFQEVKFNDSMTQFSYTFNNRWKFQRFDVWIVDDSTAPTKPDPVKPDPVDPSIKPTEPVTPVKPDPVKPDPKEPDPKDPDPKEPETKDPDPKEPDPVKPNPPTTNTGSKVINNTYEIAPQNLKRLQGMNLQDFNTEGDLLFDWSNLIVGAMKYPFKIPANSSKPVEKVFLGSKAFNVRANEVKGETIDIDLGVIETKSKSKNLLDYKGVVAVLHLPHLPSVNLDLAYVMDEKVGVQYRINLSDGSTIVTVTSSKVGGTILTIPAKLGTQIPMIATTGVNSLRVVNLTALTQTGYNGVDQPIIEILKPDYKDSDNPFSCPISDFGKLDTVTGFTTIDNIKLKVHATQREKFQILQLLKQGVFFNE